MKYPKINIDGPYDAVAGDALSYDIAVMIGAGIGVTPFASWLKSLKHRIQKRSELKLLKALYFVWICRDITNFKWFLDILQEIEQHPELCGKIYISLYCTSTNKEEQRRTLHAANDRRISGLRSFRAHIGRPKVQKLLSEVADSTERSLIRNKQLTGILLRAQVGVFCCAPESLNREVKQLCKEMSTRLVDFEYQQEY
jgi:NADPH oxidase